MPSNVKAKAQGRSAGGGVQRVTFPFKAAIAQIAHRIINQQIGRLRGGAGALHQGRKMDMAQFYRAMGFINAHEGRHARRLAINKIGMEQEGQAAWRL